MWGLLLKRNLVSSQVGCCFLSLVKPLDSSGALDLAGDSSLAIFVATAALSEHLDFIRMKELYFKNNSCCGCMCREMGDGRCLPLKKTNLLWALRGIFLNLVSCF